MVRRSVPARLGLNSSHWAAFTKSEESPDSASISTRFATSSETGRAATDKKAALQLKTANWIRAATEITSINAAITMDIGCPFELFGPIGRSYCFLCTSQGSVQLRLFATGKCFIYCI